jgi:hypothetical protein
MRVQAPVLTSQSTMMRDSSSSKARAGLRERKSARASMRSVLRKSVPRYAASRHPDSLSGLAQKRKGLPRVWAAATVWAALSVSNRRVFRSM